MKRAIDYLKKWRMLDWDILLYGLEPGWTKKDDLIDYAYLLLENIDDDNLAVIAGGYHETQEELRDIIQKYLIPMEHIVDLERIQNIWRMACLQQLSDADFTDQEKVDKLQLIDADFNYPLDMMKCSVYGGAGTDILKEMKNVITHLKRQYHVEN